MRRLQIFLIIWIMIVASAYAQQLRVTLSGTYPADVPSIPGIQAGADFTISFITDLSPVPSVVQEDGNAFGIRVDATYTSNGTSTTIRPGEVGSEAWFDYPSGYAGIDLRFPDWLSSGDGMQIIFVFPTSGYTGSASTPTLKLIDLDAGGFFYPGVHTPGFGIINAHYSVAELTPKEAVELLLDDIEALLEAGTLTQNQADGLMDKLEAAIASLNRGATRATCGQLKAFINQVNAFIKAGILPPDEGQELIDAAQAVREQIGC